MQRADELFDIEWHSLCTPLVDATWHTHGASGESFIAVADSHWEIVVTRQGGTTRLTLRGPEPQATILPVPDDTEFFGIRFAHGTFMPHLPPRQLADQPVTLDQAADATFRLNGHRLEIPGPHNADIFVDTLVEAGLLVHDPATRAALHGQLRGLSTRSVERRVSRATGLTRGTIRQIRRAETALELLTAGMPALDVAHTAGYADQPHLTRSLKHLIGQTPSQIVASVVRR